MEVKIQKDWKKLLNTEFNKEYFKTLTEFIRNEYKTKTTSVPLIF